METADRKLLLKLFYMNYCSATIAIRKFGTTKGIKKKENLPCESTVRKIVKKFEEHGTVCDLPRSGRPSLITDETIDAVTEIMDALKTSGAIPNSRNIAGSLDLSAATVWRILRAHLHLFPYKIQIGQLLTESQKERRTQFCINFLSNFIENDLYKDILFSDEAYFSVNGLVNRQNTRFWGSEQPREVVEKKSFDEKLLVWAGFSYSYRIPIVILEGNLNSEIYLDMLKRHVLPYLQSNGAMRTSIFQQDGARCHTSEQSLNFLRQKFANRILSDRTDRPWPPNSPDLTPLDFFLWGYLRNQVYKNPRPKTIFELREKIIQCYNEIPRAMFRHACCAVPKRIQLCLERQGGHFE